MTQVAIDSAAAQQLRVLADFARVHKVLRGEIAKAVIGQERVVDELFTAIASRGHALIIGVPGLAKTLMVQTLADVLQLSFRRIQFTPDLLPADITGTEVLEEDRTTGKRVFRFVHGPVFANVVLADEINRTPPKTQAALLQSMQERSVSVANTTHKLPDPFVVLATQNPIEQEGTYPLPEAQLDRFMFALKVDYPTAEQELAIAKTTTGEKSPDLGKVLDARQILDLQQTVRRVAISDHVADYAVRLTRASRPQDSSALPFVKQFVKWGAGPRAVQFLVLGAKARAVLAGTANVSCNHIRSVAPIVLRHRVLMNFAAEAAGIDADQIVSKLLESIPENPPK